MNRVEVSGGVTRDPELRYTDGGAAVMNLQLAVNGARYDSDTRTQVVDTTYVTVELWGSLAEDTAEQELSKGCEVHVLGTLTQQERVKRDGTKESKTRVRGMVVNVVRRRSGTAAKASVVTPSTPRVKPPRSSGPPPHTEPPPGYAADEEPF